MSLKHANTSIGRPSVYNNVRASTIAFEDGDNDLLEDVGFNDQIDSP